MFVSICLPGAVAYRYGYHEYATPIQWRLRPVTNPILVGRGQGEASLAPTSGLDEPLQTGQGLVPLGRDLVQPLTRVQQRLRLQLPDPLPARLRAAGDAS